MAAGGGEVGDMGAGGVGPGGEFRGEVGGMGGSRSRGYVHRVICPRMSEK